MKIQVIIGTTRTGRKTERIAKWAAAKAAQQPGFEVELIDLADYQLEHFSEPISPRYNRDRHPAAGVARWLAKAAEADGYIIVTPEYNHSIPGVLKDALDNLDFQMAKKPVAIISHGSVGGARAAEHLKGILIEAKAAVVPEAVALMNPDSLFDPDGQFIGDAADPRSPENYFPMILGELAWWTETLKAGRHQPARV